MNLYRLPLKNCSCLLLAVLFTFSVEAVWKEGVFKWVGDSGYSVIAEFTFSDSVDIAQGGYGGAPAVGLERLAVFVYGPAGKFLFAYRDIVNGYSKYHWLSFKFNVKSRDFVEGSEIDVGNDPGFYLWGVNLGTEQESMGLVIADQPGEQPVAVDSGGSYEFSFPEPYHRIPITVDDQGPGLMNFILALALVGYFRLRKRFS